MNIKIDSQTLKIRQLIFNIQRVREGDVLVAVSIGINGEAQGNSTESRQSSNSSGVRSVSVNEAHQASTNKGPVICGVRNQVKAGHGFAAW